MSTTDPPAPRSAPAARRKLRPGWSLKVAPEDLSLRPMSFKDWLREIWFAGSLGVIASMIAHVIAMIVMALIVISHPERTEADPYLISWLDPSQTPPETKRKPVSLPLTIATAPTPSPSAPPETVTPPAATAYSSQVAVRPADVRGALGGRGAGTGGGGAANPGELERLGGSASAQSAIKSGLAWLARQQTSDGRWELHQGYPDPGRSVVRTDTGATALALLALLGAGHTPYSGDHAQVVKKGLQWLIDVQDRETGDLHDQRQEEGRQPAFYAHAMGTIALCEALAMTKDDRWLGPPAQKAVEYLLGSQHPDNGGWKYRPISRMMVGDLSVTGWALMALHTARMAGLKVPQADFERASAFLDSVQTQQGARYKYEPLDPANRVTAALTAEGLLCRQWLGWPKDHPPMQNGVNWLLSDENAPEWMPGRRNVYAWYYTAQMLHNLGGDPWQKWYPPVRDTIVKHQVSGGSAKSPNDVRGSWHPTQPPGLGEEYSDKAGRLYVTAMCLLILETPYRHRPLYEE